jgi:2-oxo-3-hexenedioate decarboxylase
MRLAEELMLARATRRTLSVPLSTREPGFDLARAYEVAAELTRRRRASGRSIVGRKVGYANKAVWRALKLDTLVWAPMYDDTVIHRGTSASLSLASMSSPRIEPEIVFKLREPIDTSQADPVAILRSVEWLALGFEIVDSVFADWKFQPADFVAAFGLHAGLVVGAPRRLEPDTLPALAEQLAQFRVELCRNGETVAEGSGRNVLRSPALCLGELAGAIEKRPSEEPLLTGELVSSGTLTESQPIVPGETWTTRVAGIELADLTLHTTAVANDSR